MYVGGVQLELSCGYKVLPCGSFSILSSFLSNMLHLHCPTPGLTTINQRSSNTTYICITFQFQCDISCLGNVTNLTTSPGNVREIVFIVNSMFGATPVFSGISIGL